MNFQRWNEVLGEALLNEGPDRPVYFSATEAELQRINDRFGLGLADPVDDLRCALDLYSFLSFGALHRNWEQSRTKDLPPWLPFLAATTVVVDQQTERGSQAFYRPLSDFLGRSKKITDEEYEWTFYVWWVSLMRWLLDEDRHGGTRGFATWSAIPQSGKRCIIGHPYTQVMLRREERKQIDSFLSEFDHLGAEPPTAVDREAVAHQLVDALRRWARAGRAVGGRLRKILEGPDGNETLSLGYILLGRLFDEFSGQQRAESAARIVRVVPAYDDYERTLRLVAVAPNWTRSDSPVSVPYAEDALRVPGDIVHLDLAITDEVLRHGLDVGAEVSARLDSRPRYVMAARQWALWCSVDDVTADEEVVALLPADEAKRLDDTEIRGIRDLPNGWAVCGPLPGSSLPPQLRGALGSSNRQLVPQLRGGLQLERGIYLHGGEPVLGLAGAALATVDGQHHDVAADSLPLSTLGLPAGQHQVDIGGFQFQFQTIRSGSAVDVRPTLGRGESGDVVGVAPELELVTGARLYPTEPSDVHSGLIPFVDRFYKFGTPGEIGVVDPPQYAPWASAAGLPHLAVELHARTTHPYGDRLVREPRWLAWRTPEGFWTITEWSTTASGRDQKAPFIPKVWQQLCQEIGPEPRVCWFGTDGSTSEVLARWCDYRESRIVQ
jgi:hypothetical protein